MPLRFGLDVPPHQRRPVAWYALPVLRRIAREQLWSQDLLRNIDRRETFTQPLRLIDLSALGQGPHHAPPSDASLSAVPADTLLSASAPSGDPQSAEFWFDFIADTGDGGNATYAVARAALAAELQVEGLPAHDALRGQPRQHGSLPEGQLLILGGDLAYPNASPALYQYRLVEPFELARDAGSRFAVQGDAAAAILSADALPLAGHRKIVAAIPQNHDWIDSASTFCRTFVNDQKAGLIGAHAPQRHTYFALQLPHNWIVLGLDFALTGDLDRAQFEAFRCLVESGTIAADANLVLIYPEPYWTRPLGDGADPAFPRRYQRLEYLLQAHGLHIRMRLSGDLHHYVRERLDADTPRSVDLVVCGNGGAFGHGTHFRESTAPKVERLEVAPDAVHEEMRGRCCVGIVAGEPRAPTAAYPPLSTSRRAAWGNLWALLRLDGRPLRESNLSFSLGLGSSYLLAALVTASAQPAPRDFFTWLQALLTQPVALAAVALVLVIAFLTAVDGEPSHTDGGTRAGAVAFSAAQLPLVFALHCALLWPPLASRWLEFALARPASFVQAAWLLALAWAVATLMVGLVYGLFLAVMSVAFGRIVNNASSALGSEDHKGFLRFRITAQGIEVFMLGCDQVPKHWLPRGPGARPYWDGADSAGTPRAARWRVVDHFLMK